MDGGGGRAIKFLYALSGPSRAIKFLYAPAPLPPTVWALKTPWWDLHLLSLYLANICVCTRTGMLVCTHIMLVCTHRVFQGGLLYIKTLLGPLGGGWALDISSFWAPNGTRLSARCHFTGSKQYARGRISHRCINSYYPPNGKTEPALCNIVNSLLTNTIIHSVC